MRLFLQDAVHTESLASFLRSVGQTPVLVGPDALDVDVEPAELEVYLRVWQVLHPDADVTMQA